jgi:toxic protein SymE
MTSHKPRKLKIHTKFRKRAFDCVTIPIIKLEGKWLEKLGFKQGQYVNVKEERYKLTITIDNSKKK